jgi:predicted ATPase
VTPAVFVANVEISNYRSIRRINFPLGRLNVFVGENGVGKTNLYRGLELAQAAAKGTLARELAGEGGMDSAFWSGPRKKNEAVRIGLGVGLGVADTPGAFTYRAGAGMARQYGVEIGVRRPMEAGFLVEPMIKEEHLIFRGSKRPQFLLERKGAMCYARDDEGTRHDMEAALLPSETALAAWNDAGRFADLHEVRRAMLSWRFYHGFRTDRDSALRQPCLATTTPTLSSDGHDLAAVFATLKHIREDTVDLDAVIEDAFPSARIAVPEPGRTASFQMIYAEFPQRAFEASELSDGTLRFLALAGALLGYRLPRFIALNEPETSLHPDLLPPLARLISRAAERTQIWVVTHSTILADALAEASGITPRRVIKRDGATTVEGLTIGGEFRNDRDD